MYHIYKDVLIVHCFNGATKPKDLKHHFKSLQKRPISLKPWAHIVNHSECSVTIYLLSGLRRAVKFSSGWQYIPTCYKEDKADWRVYSC